MSNKNDLISFQKPLIISVFVIVISFKELGEMKKDEVKKDNFPQTNIEFKPVTYVSISFIDTFRILSCGLEN